MDRKQADLTKDSNSNNSLAVAYQREALPKEEVYFSNLPRSPELVYLDRRRARQAHSHPMGVCLGRAARPAEDWGLVLSVCRRPNNPAACLDPLPSKRSNHLSLVLRKQRHSRLD